MEHKVRQHNYVDCMYWWYVVLQLTKRHVLEREANDTEKLKNHLSIAKLYSIISQKKILLIRKLHRNLLESLLRY